MTKDLSEKNLLAIKEVFADISNVNLYDGKNVVQPEDLELLPQEMIHRDSEGNLARMMGDVRMRYRKKGIIIALIQLENQTEIDNTMPIRDLGYIYNNYNEQIKQHKRENEKKGKRYYARQLADEDRLAPVVTIVLYYGKEEWKRPLTILDMLELDEEEKKQLQPFLLNHRIHLIPLQNLAEETVEKYQSDFWHVIKFLSIQGRGKRRKYLKESVERPVRHPREVTDVLYALSKDKRFLEIEDDGKGEAKMGPISEMLDELELMGFERGIEQGIEQGIERERCRVNQLTAALINDNRTAELFQATQDPELQKRLMEEYGIE